MNAVEARLADLQERWTDRAARFDAVIAEELLSPLAAALERAESRHEEIAAPLRALLTGGATACSECERRPADCWQTFTDYRLALREDIVEELDDLLGRLSIASALTERWKTLAEELLAVAEEMPEFLTREEPASLYGAVPGDGPVLAARKALVRSRRGVEVTARKGANGLRRLIRRPALAPPGREQSVPLRHLAAYHVRARLEPETEDTLEAWHQVLGQIVLHVEAIVNAWFGGAVVTGPDQGRVQLAIPADLMPADPGGIETSGEQAADETAVETGTTEESARDEGSEFCRSVVERLDRIEALLRDVVDLAGASAPRATEAIAHVQSRLIADADRSDSFRLDPGKQRLPPPGRDAGSRVSSRGEEWRAWHEAARDKLRSFVSSTVFTQRGGELEHRLIRSVAEGAIRPTRDVLAAAATDLRAVGSGVLSHLADITGDVGPEQGEQLAEWLEEVRVQAVSDLRNKLKKIEALGPAGLIHKAADETVGALAESIGHLPESFELHAVPEDITGSDIDPGADTWEVRPRDIARRSLDVLALEKVRQSAERPALKLEETTAAAFKVAEILEFNLDAAAEELRPANGFEDKAADLDSARELARNAFESGAAQLEGGIPILLGALQDFAEGADSAFAFGWRRMLSQMRVEDRVRDQLVAIQSRLTGQLRGRVRELERAIVRAWGQGAVHVRRLDLRIRNLARRGQSTLGVGAVDERQALITVEALISSVEKLREAPLVYRRLFTFEPVSHGRIVGRDEEIRRVESHLRLRSRGVVDSLLLVGQPGSGKTSLLNDLSDHLLADRDPAFVSLEQRVGTEEELAAILGDALEVPDVGSIEDLGEKLLQAREDRVCIIDDLEHLMLRHVGGMELLRKTLVLFSRTDSRVMWIGAINQPGWAMARVAEQAATGLVKPIPVQALGRVALEEAILTRHQRSGLNLAFELPEGGTPLFRRRLRRAPGEQERQVVLRNDFFDRLYRATQGSIALALLYWMRAAQFDSEKGLVRMQPLRPLDFSYVNAVTQDEAYSLRAFLEHRTLTPEEHARVLGTSEAASRDTMEVLGNLLLIHGVEGGEAGAFFDMARSGRRYRIRRVMEKPVSEVLRSRRLLY